MEEYQKLKKKRDFAVECFEKAAKKVACEYYYEAIHKDPGMLNNFLPDSEVENIKEYVLSKEYGQRYKYLMITVNPKEGMCLTAFHKQIRKSVKKIFIAKSMYCFEWRNIDEGLHCHIKIWLKKRKKEVYNIKREFYNTFKHLVGNKQHVNARYSNRDGCFEDYIMGMKAGKPKDTHQVDVEMRKKHGLKDIYEHINEK